MESGTHYRAKDRGELTPRQEEILSLIACGSTNSQIAEHLGITLDGAKWHVSEIIAKLGVDSREEAVQSWRAQQSLSTRFARRMRGLLAPIAVHKLVIASVTVAAVGAVAAGVLFLGTLGGPAESAHELLHSSTFGQIVNPLFFNRVQMIDSNVGWAQFQSLSQGSMPSAIIRTEDGARTWRNASPVLAGDETIHTVFFLDATRAWVLVDQITAANPPALQIRTSRVAWTADAGNTWRESAPLGAPAPMLPRSADRLQMTFADSRHGWVVDNTGTLLRTTDSGETWHRVSVSSGTNSRPVTNHLPASCGVGLIFRDAEHGFATGVCENESDGLPIVFSTDDGGVIWKRQFLPLPGNPQQSVAGCQCFVGQPTFPTALDGFLALWSPIPEGSTRSTATSWLRTVYATHDAGRTWQVVGAPHVGETFMGALRFVDATHGWLGDATQDSINAFRTVDGGLTWELLPDRLLPPFNFISPNEGWAISTPDLASNTWSLIHTLDGGQTWQRVVPGSP